MKKKPASPESRHASVPMRFLSLAMDNLWNLVKLNIVFLISCIPIVTIGPALTALSHLTAQMVRDEEELSFPVKQYIFYFRQSFSRALPMGLLILLLHIVFGGGLLIYGSMMSAGTGYLLPCSCSLLVLLFTWGIGLHLFPMLAQPVEENLLSNAAMHALQHMGKTILAVILMIVLLMIQLMTFPVSLPVTLSLGIALPSLAGSFAYVDTVA